MLFKLVKQHEPDLIEMTAIASVMHSFYNGLENIFLQIAKNMDNFTASNYNWHAELLKTMYSSNSVRSNVITVVTASLLQEYLGFRHFFRHSYKFKLDWEKLEKLVNDFDHVWLKVKQEITDFVE